MKRSRRWLELRSEVVSTEFEVALDQGGSLDDLSAVGAEVEAVMIAAMNDRGWLMRRAWVHRRYLRSLRRGSGGVTPSSQRHSTAWMTPTTDVRPSA